MIMLLCFPPKSPDCKLKRWRWSASFFFWFPCQLTTTGLRRKAQIMNLKISQLMSVTLNNIWKSAFSQTVSKQFKLYSNNYFCLRPVGDSLIHCLTCRKIDWTSNRLIHWLTCRMIDCAGDRFSRDSTGECLFFLKKTVWRKDGAGRATLSVPRSLLFSPAVSCPLNPAHGCLAEWMEV